MGRRCCLAQDANSALLFFVLHASLLLIVPRKKNDVKQNRTRARRSSRVPEYPPPARPPTVSKKHGLKQRPPEVDDQASYPMSSYVTSSPRTASEAETAEPAQSVIRRVQDKYTTVALTMAFLLYSTVSTVIFQVCILTGCSTPPRP